MSTPILILGDSGTGKSASMRNLVASDTLLIQALNKPLPFKSADWVKWDAETQPKGNVFVTDKAIDISTIMQKTKRPIVVIDDFQYVLANELMRRFQERGYDKFSEIGYNGWNLCNVASQLDSAKRVYILAHTMVDDDGVTRIKTPGKLLSTYTIEGMFSLVLRTCVRDGEYYFSTHNNGSDTVKTPMNMFKDDLIPNDIAAVDKAICEYYGIACT